jgi:hypothetical protein
MRSLLGSRTRLPARKHRLGAIEQVLGNQRLEVAALSATAVLGDVHDAGRRDSRPGLLARQHRWRVAQVRIPSGTPLNSVGPRRQGPFVAINCGALVESMIEAELFGIEERTAPLTCAAAVRTLRLASR